MARRRRRHWRSRLRGALRRLLAFLFSNVGVVLLVLAYTIAGAFLFLSIEGAGEAQLARSMALERNATALYLWRNVTLPLNLFNETELKHRINLELRRYQTKVVVAHRRGWEGGDEQKRWTFSSALLYCLTVITTIGYGNLSPRTSWGKLMTMLYALLGMPLFLLYLSNVGELLASWFKWLYALACLCRGCPGFNRRRVARYRAHPSSQVGEFSEAESIERPEPPWRNDSASSGLSADALRDHGHRPYHTDYSRLRRPGYSRTVSEPYPLEYRHSWREQECGRHGDGVIPSLERRCPRGRSMPADFGLQRDSPGSSSAFTYVTFDAQTITVPISVCVCILVGYIIFGSMIFGLWEKWDQLDGAYFCFISLSSIGFGDFVPGESVVTPTIETPFIVCALYLMLGMALVAMCFNLMQEQVIHYFAGVKRALRRLCRCLHATRPHPYN